MSKKFSIYTQTQHVHSNHLITRHTGIIQLKTRHHNFLNPQQLVSWHPQFPDWPIGDSTWYAASPGGSRGSTACPRVDGTPTVRGTGCTGRVGTCVKGWRATAGMWLWTITACPGANTGVPKEEGGNPCTAWPNPGDIGTGRAGKLVWTIVGGMVIGNWGEVNWGTRGMATKGWVRGKYRGGMGAAKLRTRGCGVATVGAGTTGSPWTACNGWETGSWELRMSKRKVKMMFLASKVQKQGFIITMKHRN